MKLFYRYIRTVFSIITIITITACGHSPNTTELTETVAPAVTDNLKNEMIQFDTEIKVAVINQVNLLAPYHFNQAKEFYSKAKNKKKAWQNIEQAKANIAIANKIADASRSTFENVMMARKQAIMSGARNYIARDLNNADKSFKKISALMEQNRLKNILKECNFVRSKYLSLELRAIKHAKLRTARALVEQAEKEGADKFAFHYLAIAKNSIKRTNDFISGNRHDHEQIEVYSRQTREAAEHLLKVTRDSKVAVGKEEKIHL